MKYRFSSFDTAAIVPELNEKCRSLRVLNVYNVGSKVFYIKLGKQNNDNEEQDEGEQLSKNFLVLENGNRIHLTEHDLIKDSTPNSFAMKLRKHLKNRRIEFINQLGCDRVIDIQFGSSEGAYHVILELYSRGNILLTDHKYCILNILRPKIATNEQDKLVVGNFYSIEGPQSSVLNLLEKNEIEELLKNAKPGDTLKKIFTVKLVYGPALLEHCLIQVGFGFNAKPSGDFESDVQKIYDAIKLARSLYLNIKNDSKGYILQKEEIKINSDQIDEHNLNKENKLINFIEFHPYKFCQFELNLKKNERIVEFDSFNKAIDLFFSNIENQKIDQKLNLKKKEAIKKLENVKKDHEKRIHDLNAQQEMDILKGRLIELNSDLVENALKVMRITVAMQMSWDSIKEMIKEAQELGEKAANSIVSLKLDKNVFTMLLSDPYYQSENNEPCPKYKIDIDMNLSAFGNATKYFEVQKIAKKKTEKTIEASSKALKNAQHKVAQTIKETQVKGSIIKARKVLWFEKFFWFISSENYIVIGGRDAHQNELIVKRYLKKGDIYVHADIHGGSTIVIKNKNSQKEIPLKTIEEAGCMAVCYSFAWEAKVPCKSWWVKDNQVSKQTESGEFLPLGSFMIRGKKNYLPQIPLILGFSFYFRVDEESMKNHLNDRKVKTLEDEENVKKKEKIYLNGEFPDTVVKVINKENNENTVVESIKTKSKQIKINLKPKVEKKQVKINIEEKINVVKKDGKSKKKKGKNNKKNDDWSDEEHIMDLKLAKKFKKENPILDLQNNIEMILSKNLEEKLNLKNDQENEEAIEENEEAIEENEEAIEENEEAIEENENNLTIITSNEEDKFEDEKTFEKKEIDESEEKIDSNNKLEDDYEGEEEEEEEFDEEHTEEKKELDYLNLVNSIIGQPLKEDNLLYAIPAVGPYNVFMNHKFKVKILPGTGKRGRCSQTAMQLFLKDKTITQKEKDLLKSVNDQDIARNLPTKLKITAQNLQTVKGKSKK